MAAAYLSITPYLIIKNAAEAILFYKTVFNAVEISRLTIGDRVGHAELKIGDARIMIAGEFPEWGMTAAEKGASCPVFLLMVVDDVDSVVNKAVEGGAEILMPVENQFYGDRSGTILDPFGLKWAISTHVEDIDDEEMRKRAESAIQK